MNINPLLNPSALIILKPLDQAVQSSGSDKLVEQLLTWQLTFLNLLY